MKKFMVADLVKAVVKDEIEDLRSKIKSKEITLNKFCR
jgi:hypothetical protein